MKKVSSRLEKERKWFKADSSERKKEKAKKTSFKLEKERK